MTALRPERRVLEQVLRVLPGIPANTLLTQETEAVVTALWAFAASAERLLVSGGDERLALNPETHLNKYGCSPWPSSELISFGSCTASSPSESAYAAAEIARRSIIAASVETSPTAALAKASEAIGNKLLRYFCVDDLAQVVLAASGTDAALIVTVLLSAETPWQPTTSLLFSPTETGSGVPEAVQGRHFAAFAPNGQLVNKGEPIDGLSSRPAIATVALRAADGASRPPEAILADIERAIEAGVARGRVVLHALDGSKTGLTAPDRFACQRLAAKFGDKLDIVIDACQARIEPALVRWYLQQGFAVLVTGSKFFAAPGFCGAVLFPRSRLARIALNSRLPAGLASYMPFDPGFGTRQCLGLVMRWTAALHAMTQFAEVKTPLVRKTLLSVGKHIRNAVAVDRRLRLVDAPRPPGMGWSDLCSVFTFSVWQDDSWLSAAALRFYYEQLGNDRSDLGPGCEIRCRTGQPVELGRPGLGGLRIAISSGQIVAGEDQGEALRSVFGKLGRLLDKLR
jgi:hypothetical protein